MDELEILIRLGLAVACGSVIGLNRYLYRKDAGLRTNALVALGAALATLIIELHGGDAQALSRVLQGLVTGVGFIGAGVIMQNSERHVRGLTTAASIWISAMMGIAMGAGDYRAGAIGLGLAMLALIIGKPIERALARWWHRDVDGDNGDERDAPR